MEFVEYPDREMLMIDLANRIAGELNSALMGGSTASLAVPGGTTPGPVFDDLSAATLDWSRVKVLLTDERWVPEDHERSNTRLIRQRLLTNAAQEAQYVPLYKPAAEPELVLDDLAATVSEELPLSVLLLGMGEDMHTASLFPDAEELASAIEGRAGPLAVVRPAGQPEARLTLTGPVLRSAMSTHVLITGDAKRAALEKAQTLGPEDAPISLVLKDAVVHWAA